jgi:hypothetical protein
MRTKVDLIAPCLAAVLALLASAGCGDDGTGPPPSMIVEVEVCALQESAAKACPAGNVMPNAQLEVSVAVDPRGALLERVIVETSGLIAQVDTFVPLVQTSQPVFGADTVFAPLAVGALTFRARAEGGSSSGESSPVTVTVNDTQAPTVLNVALLPADSVEPADTVRLALVASDNAVVMQVVVSKTGALTGADTINVALPMFADTLRYQVPTTTPFGTPLAFEVHAVDAAGLESDAVSSTSLTIADFTPPTTGGYVHTGIQDPLVPGDLLLGTVEASDNHTLAWVGYRIGSPVVEQDSFPVAGATTSHDFTATVQSSWVGKPNVALFSRDSTGNVSTQGYPLTITVLDAVRRPYVSAPGRGAVADMTYDAKRGQLYLLHSYDISVLPLSAYEHQSPIALPSGVWSAGGLDLTADRDNLLVLVSFFPDTMTLGLVDLTQALPVVDTVHLTYDKALGVTHDLGVTSNDKAFVTLWNGTGGGGVLEYDLVSGAQGLRSDVGTAGTIPSPANLLVSGDRQRMSLRWMPVPCCPNDVGQVYDVGTNAFGAVRELDFSNSRDIAASADDGGDHYLIGGYLLDSALGTVRYIDQPTSPAGDLVVSAMSSDATYGYFSQSVEETNLGLIVKVLLADGSVAERFVVPEVCQKLMVLPDGNTLVAVGTTYTLYAIDLR